MEPKKSYHPPSPLPIPHLLGLVTRFVTVSTASTPVLPLRMPPPRRISCFETHVDPPTEVGFLDTPSSLGRKGAQSGKATLHPADRQPHGYKPIHQRGAIACPWYQSLRNRVGYFGGTGEILGLGFGSFFLCLAVFLFFVFLFLFLRVAACLCVLFRIITSCSNSLF
jgi:hypothetical protein